METVLAIVLVVAVIIALSVCLKVIRPYEKGVLERLGRYQETRESGLAFIVPFTDRLVKVDMREQVVDIPPQEVITKDNVVVTVDAIVYYEPTDPVRLIYNVADFYYAVTKLAQTNLRNVIGEMELDAALTSREVINTKLRQVLDDATDKWGVRVVRVEIKRIDPPAEVVQAMHGQMKAEREKRAKILESEGARQSQILQAEGSAESVKLKADADRYQVEIGAQAEALAIKTVYGAIRDAAPDDKLIAIKYMETLEKMASGQATKIFMPLEATGVLGALAGVKEIFRDASSPNS